MEKTLDFAQWSTGYYHYKTTYNWETIIFPIYILFRLPIHGKTQNANFVAVQATVHENNFYISIVYIHEKFGIIQKKSHLYLTTFYQPLLKYMLHATTQIDRLVKREKSGPVYK